jgi:hypothetical protein
VIVDKNLVWLDQAGDIVFGGKLIKTRKLPDLWTLGHREDNQKTRVNIGGSFVDGTPNAVSSLAVQILASSKDEGISPDLAELFLKSVCAWGGESGRRVWGKHLNEQLKSPRLLCSREAALSEAISHYLSAPGGLPKQADRYQSDKWFRWSMGVLSNIRSMGGFGVSFGSKIARFIGPDDFGVWDELIAKALSKAKDSARNFAQYSLDLRSITDDINNENIFRAEKPYEKWLVADVDLALWSYCKFELPKISQNKTTEQVLEFTSNWVYARGHKMNFRVQESGKISSRCECGGRLLNPTDYREYKEHCRDHGIEI